MITHVAIKYDGTVFSLPKPNRHHDVIRMIARLNGVGIAGPDVQGFVTDTGIFLGRRQAMLYALDHEQVLNPVGHITQLYSEDLW